jgi:hypothetical protein
MVLGAVAAAVLIDAHPGLQQTSPRPADGAASPTADEPQEVVV